MQKSFFKSILVLIAIFGVAFADTESTKDKGIILIDQTIYNQAYSVAWGGSSVELQDGSIWNVSLPYRPRVSNWLPGDVITISQSHSPSTYRYALHNETLGEAADVSLTAGPFYSSSVAIAHIDYRNCVVMLSDGSYWTISFHDAWTVGSMRVGDGVLVGFNNELFPGSYGYILIDVELNDYVRAY